jgi:hypothetical protein
MDYPESCHTAPPVEKAETEEDGPEVIIDDDYYVVAPAIELPTPAPQTAEDVAREMFGYFAECDSYDEIQFQRAAALVQEYADQEIEPFRVDKENWRRACNDLDDDLAALRAENERLKKILKDKEHEI